MTKLTSANQINKIVGNMLMSQTGLAKKFILNGKSLYGANRETIDEYIASNFTENDSYVVFLLEAADTSDNMTELAADNKIAVYDSYLFTVMCYGNTYNELALQIKSRFLTEEVLMSLQNDGVHIQDIDVSQGYSEFVNGFLVNRRDVMIHISCEIDVSKVTIYDEMSSMNDEFKIETV